MRAPGSMSLPLFGRMSSPSLPTAHSMNRPGPAGPSGSTWIRSEFAWCVILRPWTVPGRTSIARTQRGSVIPESTTGFHQVSLAPPFCVQVEERTTRSGGPPKRSA